MNEPQNDEERKVLRLLRSKEDELRDVRDEIRLRSEVLRAFPDESPDSECDAQRDRFSWLLRRERELMGDQWQT